MVRKIKEKKLIPLVNFTDYHNKLKSTHPADGKSVGEKGSISNILRCFYVLVLPMVDPIRETTDRHDGGDRGPFQAGKFGKNERYHRVKICFRD